jgi:hypothetical protein
MKGSKPSYRGSCSEDKTYSEEYKKIKDDTLSATLDILDNDIKNKTSPKQIATDFEQQFVERNNDKSAKDLAQLLNISPRTVFRIRAKIKTDKEESAQENTTKPQN